MAASARAIREVPAQVVVVTPDPADGRVVGEFLDAAGIESSCCAALGAIAAMPHERLGCVIVVEESLGEEELEAYRRAIDHQPAWSDVPLLVLASEESPLSAAVGDLFPDCGNVVMLQRPVAPWGMVSAVRIALRARHRQFAVRAMLEERGRAVRQRDEFLAMLAHELRNPLAPIRNAVYVMGHLGLDNPSFVQCREMIDRQVRHISRLVEDLVDVSRLEHGKAELRRESIDLNDAVASAVSTCRPMIAEHGHRVTLELAARRLGIMADPVRIEQAVCNLVVNAAKFTPDGGLIRVETALEGGDAVLRVTDTGTGIAADMLDSIFELFTQGQVSIARHEGGLGIGLALVKRLVEQHGGTVKASSEGTGKGACFEVRLRLAEDAGVAPARKPAGTQAVSGRHVLVVEDLPDVREALGIVLRTWKHHVSFAANGTDGIAIALETRPDIMLVDIGLPGADGYAVARAIRGDGSDWSREVKLVALTGYGQSTDRERAFEAGFDVHMVKPVDPVELGRIVNN